ncbi:MAG: bifunctional demethylmenaquinone methyltransferase/2-methoxy-6-polyprenyl-1,4-benzoquinol methylase UbiE [Deltaproteobacteria bacterium]|nr:bifunctional demethylmenaquinone methyltransferase/2-methoxy-6-polyprenyl-1,4-benzoquinol methylase UbiE [Deltaproteobacteria bacterium]
MNNDPAHDVRPGSGAMFDQIAHRYDTLNRLLSLGIDQHWRRQAVRSLNLRPGQRALDLATGTADLAMMLAKSQEDLLVVGSDPSRKMLDFGQQKLLAESLADRVSLELGDAQQLRFESNHFDGITMAFGIRNVPDRAKALREIARVTKPGGRIAILELSEPRGGLLGPIAKFHVHHVVPRLGALLSGASEYKYLQRSIAAFPAPEVFAQLMRDNGHDVLEVRPMTFGAVCLFVSTPTVH